MTPVYFPLTHFSDDIAKAATACFHQMTLYLPAAAPLHPSIKKLKDSGFLELKIPVQGDENKIEALMRDYRNWLVSHKGGEISFFKAMKNSTPFFDETSISNIRSAVKKNKDRSVASDETPDPVFLSRLFLRAAQDFDTTRQEIDKNLNSVEEMEEKLLNGLKGEADELDFHMPDVIVKDDPAEYMLKERLEAWSRLMLTDSNISGIYITPSRSVLDFILENFPKAASLANYEDIPYGVNNSQSRLFQDELIQYLETVVKKSWLDSSDNSPPRKDEIFSKHAISDSEKVVSLSLYILPDIQPVECFSSFIRSDNSTINLKGSDIQNTVIGYIA